ncbi:uncharacterized protein F5891DRAFT_1083303, partial [Suillus fuscotomentosus]
MMWSRITPVTMRFSSAIVLAVITALTSSISAMPAQNAVGADGCPTSCFTDEDCSNCVFSDRCLDNSCFIDLF